MPGSDITLPEHMLSSGQPRYPEIDAKAIESSDLEQIKERTAQLLAYLRKETNDTLGILGKDVL